MTVVETESVALWWVRQESLPGGKFKRENSGLYFPAELCIVLKRLVNVDFIFFNFQRSHIPCFKKLYFIKKVFHNNYSQRHSLFINI
jgi:hypothetical protein